LFSAHVHRFLCCRPAAGRKQGDNSQTVPTPISMVSPKVCKAGVADSASKPKASSVLPAPSVTASQLAPSSWCSTRKIP
jgi:hypothetical protein